MNYRDRWGVVHKPVEESSSRVTTCENATWLHPGAFIYQAADLTMTRDVPTCVACIGTRDDDHL